jgi:hypothetical protein
MGNAFELVWRTYHPTPDHLVFHLTTSSAMSRMTRIVSQKHVFGRACPAKVYRYLSTFRTSKVGVQSQCICYMERSKGYSRAD